jgi:hypothetical protein
MTSNVKKYLVLNFGLSPMADVFGQGRCYQINIGIRQMLMTDDYHAEGGTRWKSARVKTTGSSG